MPRIIITLSVEEKFIDKFFGFLKNILLVNRDNKSPIIINSIEFEDKYSNQKNGRIKSDDSKI